MKKLFVFLMAMLIVFSVAACSEKPQEENKEKTYTGVIDDIENCAVTLKEDGKFVLKAKMEEEAGTDDLSTLGIEGTLVMSAIYTVNGTYTVADDKITVTLNAEKGTIESKISGSAADSYRKMIRSLCESQEEYDEEISKIEGVKEVDDLDKTPQIIVIDDKTMTFTSAD